MTLYEIDQAIMDCVDMETGEIIDMEKLDFLQMERAEKLENVGLWIKDLKAESDAIKKEIDTLQKRKRTADNKADSLKNYLEYALDGEKFKTPRLAVSYRKSEAVNITDFSRLGEIYLNFPDPVPDKKAIKEAIKAGQEVEGAELVTKTSVQVR